MEGEIVKFKSEREKGTMKRKQHTKKEMLWCETQRDKQWSDNYEKRESMKRENILYRRNDKEKKREFQM